MHFRTHTKTQSIGQSGRWQSPYHDAMIDHDKNVGTVLKALDDLGIADNTFVMYATDNGPHMNSWPDAAMTPFRSEKNSNWEGAYRVPAMFRWPGKIKPGQVSNEISSHLDMLPTILGDAPATLWGHDKGVWRWATSEVLAHFVNREFGVASSRPTLRSQRSRPQQRFRWPTKTV